MNISPKSDWSPLDEPHTSQMAAQILAMLRDATHHPLDPAHLHVTGATLLLLAKESHALGIDVGRNEYRAFLRSDVAPCLN